MGRIQTGQANPSGPPPPQPQSGQPPYPPQPNQPPLPQHNFQQPHPPPPNAVHTVPQYKPPQHQASYNAYPQSNTAQKYTQPPPPVQGHYGFMGAPAQTQVANSPMHASGNFAQPNNAYSNGGGGMPPRTSTYPGSSGFQMPKLWPRGNGGFVGTKPWNTGLFDCMQDPTNAFVTALFPCVTFGQIADVLDNGNTTCVTSGVIYGLSPCMLSRSYRTKLRRMFGLVEAPAADWIVHTIFEPCALCQEYRELNSRGIDPALGYHGNKERMQNQQAAATSNSPRMFPPQNQTMA